MFLTFIFSILVHHPITQSTVTCPLPSLIGQKHCPTSPPLLFPLLLQQAVGTTQEKTCAGHMIFGLSTPYLTNFKSTASACRALLIALHPSELLNQHLMQLPSGDLYRTIAWKKIKFSRSFITSVITELNKTVRYVT